MLPLGARRPAQQVNRPRLRYEILPLPALACFEAQAEGAGRKKRNADNVTEDRAILVPADSCTRRVFGNENLLKPARRVPAKACARARTPERKAGMSSVLVSPPPLKSYRHPKDTIRRFPVKP